MRVSLVRPRSRFQRAWPRRMPAPPHLPVIPTRAGEKLLNTFCVSLVRPRYKFRIRTLALAAQRAGANQKLSPLAQVLEMIPGRARWTGEEKRAAARILQAKRQSEESRYLKDSGGGAFFFSRPTGA